jgi:SAM-dependent methyltransferase
MDRDTIRVYEERAAEFCAAYRAIYPAPLYDVMRRFLHPGEPTADIGSGSGRDVGWLRSAGFPAVGYEPTPRMRAQAMAAYPGLDFHAAGLPELDGIASGRYGNVLCLAVLMHVRRQDLGAAVLNLARISRPGGRLVLTVRPGRAASEREADGRLFTHLRAAELTPLLEAAGFQVISEEKQADTLRADVTWNVLLAQKGC